MNRWEGGARKSLAATICGPDREVKICSGQGPQMFGGREVPPVLKFQPGFGANDSYFLCFLTYSAVSQSPLSVRMPV